MEHPGRVLEERFLQPIGLTPYALAKAIGVQQTRLSQILRGKRRISPDTAVRLGAYFRVPPAWFLALQSRWDLEQASSAAAEVEPIDASTVFVTPNGARLLDAEGSPGRPPEVGPSMLQVDPELGRRLEEQAALAPARPRREMEEVRYENGMRGLVSVEP